MGPVSAPAHPGVTAPGPVQSAPHLPLQSHGVVGHCHQPAPTKQYISQDKAEKEQGGGGEEEGEEEDEGKEEEEGQVETGRG